MTENRSRETPAVDEGHMVPRFHAAHRVAGDSGVPCVEPEPDLVLAVAGKAADHAAQQLHRQATELADHLQLRQRELSRWEARLHTQAAACDDELRSARLWLQEQQYHLNEREAELERRQLATQQREAELAAAAATADALARRQGEMDKRQQELLRQERALAERSRQLSEQLIAWQHQRDRGEAAWRAQAESLEQQRRDVQRADAAARTLHEQLRRQSDRQRVADVEYQRCAELRANLERMRDVLREQEHTLQQQQRVWHLEQERGAQRTRRQRENIARTLRSRAQTLQLQQKTLRLRREQLDQRGQALDQRAARLRHDEQGLISQRIALLASREAGSAAWTPAALADLEHCVGTHLSEQLSLLEATRQQQRHELQQLATALAAQQEALLVRQESLERCAAERQRELDEQAVLLAAQEQDVQQLHQQLLHAKRAELSTLDQQWAAALTKNVLPPGQDA